MAMNVGTEGGDDEPMVEMNTTPLIDVLLVLLVMLIITIPLQTQAVKLDMPQMTVSEEHPDPVVVDLEVDFDGTVFWNGNAVPTTVDLEDRFVDIAGMQPQPEVHLRPNRLVKYDYVAKVLSAAQRLGVTKIGFVGNEQYME